MKKVAVVICVLLLVGCATSVQVNTAYKGLALTKATAEAIVSAAKVAKAGGQISDVTYAEVIGAYNKGKLANDAVIDAFIGAINAGIDPATSPNYTAAMTSLGTALMELKNLAVSLGLLKS